MTAPTIFLSVGEPSGDLHGANLIAAIRHECRDVHCGGFGGPRMREAGCDIHFDLTELAVMWIGRVISNLPRFLNLLKDVDRLFAQSPPDIVVLIDYPGFNWHVAKRAHAHGIPVVYYGVPQLWAWAPWRVRKMRRLVDLALCKLPFEQNWFSSHGVAAEYVGHPYFDELSQRPLDADVVNGLHETDRPLVTLLPGSRTQEVEGNLPWLLDAAAIIRQRQPGAQIAIASFNPSQADIARRLSARTAVDVEIMVGRTPELIASATCCLACSGSVSLELLYHRKPSVIVYRVGALGYLLQDLFRTAHYITLANLLAADAIDRRPFARLTPQERDTLPFPEFLATRNCARQLADRVCQWLDSPDRLQAKEQQLDEIASRYIHQGASTRAARRILDVHYLGHPTGCRR